MIYKDLHTSIIRFCRDYAETWGPASFVNLDAAWDEAQLPEGDLVGPMGLSFEIDDQLIEGSVQIGYSTINDKNLFRLVDKVSGLAELLRPGSRIPIYDADSGALVGQLMIMNGTRIMPISGTKHRPLQFIGINFGTTITYQPLSL